MKHFDRTPGVIPPVKRKRRAYDWGAAVCWQFCMGHPERVDRYVAVSVGHPTAYAKGPLNRTRIKRISASSSIVPVELTAIEVGPGKHGREMISLDVSQFGDPLDSRCIRVPYSRYLKMEQQKGLLGYEIIADQRIVDRQRSGQQF